VKTDDYKATLAGIVEHIDQESLSAFDFGRLREVLVEAQGIVDEVRRLNAEVGKFRQDYLGRISGMEKAMAVVARGEGKMSDALQRIEALEDLPAEKLIECYSRAQARYRDAFPASFGVLRTSPGHARKDRVKEYR